MRQNKYKLLDVISLLLIFSTAMIKTDNMAIPTMLVITSGCIFIAKYLLNRKRTHKSGNFCKFN